MFKQKPKTQRTFKRALVLVLPVLFVVSGLIVVMGAKQPVYAATSDTVNFQARLLTAAGNVVPDGYYNVEFKIYKAESSAGSSQGSCTGDATNCAWTETRIGDDKVRVANGYLTVNLGSVTAFPGTMPWDQQLWLTMNIGGTGSPAWDGEMNPRLKLTATPYSFASGKLVSTDGTGSATVANGDVGTICIQNASNCGFIRNQANALQTATTNLKIQGNVTDGVNLAVQAAVGQTVDIFEVQDSSGAVILGVSDAQATLNRSIVITGSGASSNQSLVVKANTAMNNTHTILDVQQNNGASSFRVNGGGEVFLGGTTGVQGTVNISSGVYYGQITAPNLTLGRSYALPDEGGIICLQGKVSCGFVEQNSNSYIKNQQLVMQQAGIWVQGTDASKISFTFQAPAASTQDIFRVQNATATAAVSITASGALAFTGDGLTTFTTPAGANVPSKIKINAFDPGSFGQILAFGLNSAAQNSARAISLFDARTGSHQPTISVFSPNENDVFGFSWDGSNTLAAVKSSGSQIAIRTNTGDVAQFGDAIDLNRATNITGTQAASSALYVQGAASATAPVAIIRSGATPGTDADLLQVQNSSGTARFAIDNTGNVAIGAATADRTLDISINDTVNTAAAIRLAQAGTGDAAIELGTTSRKFNIGVDNSSGSIFKIASSTGQGTSFNVGQTTVGTSGPNDQGNNGLLVANRVTTVSAGTVSSISLYIAQVDPSNKLATVALYAHSGGNPGKPGALITSTGTQTLHTGWNVFPVSATVAAATTYWLGFQVNGATTGVAYQNTTAYAYFFNSTFNTWSSDLTAASDVANTAMIYSTYMSGTTVAGTGDVFNASLLAMSDSGTTFKTVTNSSDAFRVVNSSDQTIFRVDSAENRVSIRGGVSGDIWNNVFEIRSYNDDLALSADNYGRLYLNSSNASYNAGIRFNYNNNADCVESWLCLSMRKGSNNNFVFSAEDGVDFWVGNDSQLRRFRLASDGKAAFGTSVGSTLYEDLSVQSGSFGVRNGSAQILRIRTDSGTGATRLESGTADMYLSTWDQTNFAGGEVVHLQLDDTGVLYLKAPQTVVDSSTLNINSATVNLNNIPAVTGTSGRPVCILSTGTKRLYYGPTATTCSASSQRYKHSIQSMSEQMGLESLLGLRPVTFVYNEGDGTTEIGLIAEEVSQILPEAVEYDEQGRPNAINYEFMVANIIKGIQQQQVQISELQQGIWNGGLVSNDMAFNGFVTFNSGVRFVSDVDFDGKATFNGSVAFNENTTGSVILPGGETEIEVVFTQPYMTVPNISVSSSDFVQLKVQDKTINGFKIVIANSIDHDITIDWIALQARQTAQAPDL